MSTTSNRTTPEMVNQFVGEPNYSDPNADDFEALSRDRVPVRSLLQGDLEALIRIDRRITGRDRTGYYKRKVAEAIEESGVRVSVVAEMQGEVAGFIMARVDYGEFGRTSTDAVIDTVGVDPAYAKKGVGHALISQLLTNLDALRVEQVRTEVEWNDFGLLSFLDRVGFKPSQRLAFVRKRK